MNPLTLTHDRLTPGMKSTLGALLHAPGFTAWRSMFYYSS